MPKTKKDALGHAIIKNKAQIVRSKKQELREKKKVEKAAAGLLPETGLQSVLDINNLDDFLDTVALSQRSFETEKGAAVIIDRDVKAVVPTVDPELANKYRSMQIPRRPLWDMKRSPEEQDRMERLDFLEWRRNVAKQVESSDGAVAPFEKNLEVWRQLWRVVEKSDCLVQIVDSRNPLLFRCPDVEVYAKEVNPHKRCVLIVNKADLIPEHVRLEWGRYFDSVNIGFVFFSAKQASQAIEKEAGEKAAVEKATVEKEAGEEEAEEEAAEESEEEESEESDEVPTRRSENAFASLMDDSDDDESDDDDDDDDDHQDTAESPNNESAPSIAEDLRNYVVEDEGELAAEKEKEKEEAARAEAAARAAEEKLVQELHVTAEEQERYRIRSREEVLRYLEEQTQQAYEEIKQYELEREAKGETEMKWVDRRAVVGMVGFPNVGKSSLINVLLGVSATSHGAVRVAVGATPGKTKHLQTVNLSDTLMLCDCPGLVFPVFMNTKADLLFNGVLPASNMRDYIEPIRLVCQRTQREELERVYHIKLPRNPLDPPNAVPHPRQLLQAMCKQRGYMASNHSGVNEPRGAIVILKDVLNGVLKWWIPPPSMGVIPENPIASLPQKEEGMDPTLMTNEMIAEQPKEEKKDNGVHKPRQRRPKERSAKKHHKTKKVTKGGDQVQYNSKGAFQYI